MFKATRMRLLGMATVVTMAFAAPAGASPVTVTGGFTNYRGAVGYPPSSPLTTGLGPSYLNGIAVSPDTPSSRAGVGLVSFDFASGTQSVDFYNEFETHNLLQFTPTAGQTVTVGQEFLIGTFTLQNGSWFGGLGEGDSLFSFSIATSSLDPALNGHPFSDVIRFSVTQSVAGNTPEQNADYFWFDGHPELGTMRVYESSDSPTGTNVGSIDFYGRIGSLIPTRLANPRGGVFIAAPVVSAVPEPESYAMLLAGLGLVGYAAGRQKRTNMGKSR